MYPVSPAAASRAGRPARTCRPRSVGPVRRFAGRRPPAAAGPGRSRCPPGGPVSARRPRRSRRTGRWPRPRSSPSRRRSSGGPPAVPARCSAPGPTVPSAPGHRSPAPAAPGRSPGWPGSSIGSPRCCRPGCSRGRPASAASPPPTTAKARATGRRPAPGMIVAG